MHYYPGLTGRLRGHALITSLALAPWLQAARSLQQAWLSENEMEQQRMHARQQARRLGWLSIGLGLPELVTPHLIEELLRIDQQQPIIRALGLRELLAAGGILSTDTPTAWIWGRVAGDVMDLGLLLAALRSDPIQRSRIAGAAGIVLAISMVDLVCAQRLQGR